MTSDAAITALVEAMRQEVADLTSGKLTQIWSKTVLEWADTLSALGGRPETGCQPLTEDDWDEIEDALGEMEVRSRERAGKVGRTEQVNPIPS